MSWLEFISSVVGSVAWPLVVLVVAFLLRNQIGDLADSLVERFTRITDLSGMGFSAKFERDVEKLERDAADVSVLAPTAGEIPVSVDADVAVPPVERTAEAPEPTGTVGESNQSAIDREYEANVLPREPIAAVLESFNSVEASAREALVRLDPSAARPNMSLGSIMKVLEKRNGPLDEALAQVVSDLQETRNLALHGRREISREAADRYARVALRVIGYFNGTGLKHR